MDGEPRRLAERLAAPGLRQALFVERVAAFVDRAHQALREVVGRIAGRDAHVALRAAGEGMGRDVEPAVVEVVGERRQNGSPERLLLRDVVAAAQGRRRGLTAEHGVDHRRQRLGQRVEQRVHGGAAAAGVEAVEQRVVGAQGQRVGEALRLLAGQLEERLEMGREHREVRAGPRLAPHHLGLGRRGGKPLDERARQRRRADVLAAHEGEVAVVVVVEVRRVGRVEKLRDVRRRAHLVHQAGQRRHRLAAPRRRALRHHHRIVPAQDAGRGAQMRDAAVAGAKRLVGGRRHGASCRVGSQGF